MNDVDQIYQAYRVINESFNGRGADTSAEELIDHLIQSTQEDSMADFFRKFAQLIYQHRKNNDGETAHEMEDRLWKTFKTDQMRVIPQYASGERDFDHEEFRREIRDIIANGANLDSEPDFEYKDFSDEPQGY